MTTNKNNSIRVGVGGWTYEPWRGTFYPAGTTQKRELEYASRALTTIEINGTYYGSQKPESFIKWHDETPEDFVFSVKGSRFTTNRRALAEAGSSIERFFQSGVTNLKTKLGPINWQFLPTKKFDADDFDAFLKLLPKCVDGIDIRHVVEVRHESFRSPDFVAIARAHQVAIALAGDSEHPQITDITAPFSYLRIMGSVETEKAGYPSKALDHWAKRVALLASGKVPDDLQTIEAPPTKATGRQRDVFVYFISGYKTLNPAAAVALLERLKS
jgi:uncharacterized protein YecE (DUF72 family)